MRENPTLRGYLETRRGLCRGEDENGRLVYHVVRVHELGVRPANHPIGRARAPNVLGRKPLPAPRVRVALGDRTELRPQLPNPATVLVARLARRDPYCLFEERVDVCGPI